MPERTFPQFSWVLPCAVVFAHTVKYFCNVLPAALEAYRSVQCKSFTEEDLAKAV